MTVDYYRRIWTTDMSNRAVNSPWNVFSVEEWREGWRKLSRQGAYEIDFFLDLMLLAIACGLQKYMILNTSNTSSDNSYHIIDPMRFNIQPDSHIPLLLAYNTYYYESLPPCTLLDIKASVNLVQ